MRYKEIFNDRINQILILWGAFTAALYVALLMIAPGEEWASSLTYFPYDGSVVLSVVVLLLVVRFYGFGSTEGRVWALIMAGLSLWMAAELIWGLDVLLCEMGHSGMPSAIIDNTDYPFLAGYIVMASGFVYKARHTQARPNLGKAFIVLSVMGLFAISATFLVLIPTAESSGYSDSEKFFLVAYILLDIILFGMAMAIALYWGTEVSAGWHIISVGLLCMMVADVGYTALDLRGVYFDGSLIELSWVAAYLLIGLAGNYQRKLHQSFV